MLDINNQEAIRKLTFYDLVDDCEERGDLEALRWLDDERHKEETRTNKKTGKTYTVYRSLVSIRAEYLEKYCGYQPKSPSTTKREQRQKELDDKFAAAFKVLAAKKKK